MSIEASFGMTAMNSTCLSLFFDATVAIWSGRCLFSPRSPRSWHKQKGRRPAKSDTGQRVIKRPGANDERHDGAAFGY
jgi:hypothetical protein